MSLPALEFAWGHEGLSGTEKSVLVALAWHANADGDSIRPGIARLERMTALKRRTIIDVRGRLERAGVIERVGKTARGVIEFRLPGMGVQDVHPGGAADAPERSQNRQNNGDVETRPSDEQRNGADVERVWAHYVEVMKPRKREPDPEGRKIIRDALNVATVVECCRAIDGCASSDHHMGRALGTRRKYNSLSQILKAKRAGGPYGAQGQTTRERVDFFLDLAEKAGLPSGVTSADPARLRSAKREVLDAWEYPGDESVVRRGEESAAWLEQQGIQVLEDPTETNRQGRAKPRFEASA